jgi:hypothetical protein
MVQLATLRVSLDQVAGLEKSMTDLARLEVPLTTVGQLSHPMSVLAGLSPAKFAASVIITTLVFFMLLFLTIWGGVRLGSQHRSA